MIKQMGHFSSKTKYDKIGIRRLGKTKKALFEKLNVCFKKTPIDTIGNFN
jgi:hypothetical protein